jgi:Peptidase_C39 like family
MKLAVPYYSQFVDVQDSFWVLRACGAVSLKMVIEFHLSVDSISKEDGKKVPDILSLCNEAKEKGGYDMSNGWVHDYLVSKAREFGLQSFRKEGLTDLADIITSLDAGNPVIVSIEKRVLEQTRFHMIVIVGYEQNTEKGSCFYYHEPESTDKEKGQYRICSFETFMEYWRGKALFISK